MSDFFDQLEKASKKLDKAGRAVERAGGAVDHAGNGAQKVGRGIGKMTTADDEFRRVDANGEAAANNAQIRDIRSERALNGELARGTDPFVIPANGQQGLPVQGALRGAPSAARGAQMPTQSPSDALVGAVADAMRTPAGRERQAKIDAIVDYVENSPQFHKKVYNQVTGKNDDVYQLPTKGTALQHAGEPGQPVVRPIHNVASPEQLVQQLSQKLERQVGALPISQGELYLNAPAPSVQQPQMQPTAYHPEAPAAAPVAPAPAPVAHAAGDDAYHTFVKQAAAAAKAGVVLENTSLPVTDGKVVFPAGKYDTGQKNGKGEPVTIELKEPQALDPFKAESFIRTELAKNGIGKAPVVAAPAVAPAETEKPQVQPVVHKTEGHTAPVAAPASVTIAAASGPDAKSYGVKKEDMPTHLKESQVKDIQAAMKKAGIDLGEFGDKKDGVDGKWGQKSQAALVKAAKDAGIADIKTIDFANPKDPEFVKLQAHLAKEAAARAPAKAHVATQQPFVEPTATELAGLGATQTQPVSPLAAALAGGVAAAAAKAHQGHDSHAPSAATPTTPAAPTIDQKIEKASNDNVTLAVQLSAVSAANNLDNKAIILDTLKMAAEASPDGKVHLPKGEIQIPNSTTKLTFEGGSLTPEQAVEQINAKVLAASLGATVAVPPVALQPIAPAPSIPPTAIGASPVESPAVAAPAPAPRAAAPSVLFAESQVFGGGGVDKPQFGTIPSVQQMAEAVSKAPAVDEPLAPSRVPDARDPVMVAAARAGGRTA